MVSFFMQCPIKIWLWQSPVENLPVTRWLTALALRALCGWDARFCFPVYSGFLQQKPGDHFVNLVHCPFQFLRGSQVDVVTAVTATTRGQQEAEFTFLRGYVHSDKYVDLKRPIALLIEAALLNSRIKKNIFLKYRTFGVKSQQQ